MRACIFQIGNLDLWVRGGRMNKERQTDVELRLSPLLAVSFLREDVRG